MLAKREHAMKYVIIFYICSAAGQCEKTVQPLPSRAACVEAAKGKAESIPIGGRMLVSCELAKPEKKRV